jgi:PII-like signaling protein
MLSKGPAKKITIYVNEDTRYHHEPLYEAILTYLLHNGASGATASHCLAGFGEHRQMHTPKIEALAEHIPVRIEFIDTPERLDALLPTLYEMVSDGLIEVQDTNLVKVGRKESPSPDAKQHQRQQGTAKMLRVFLGEADRLDGEPLYEAIMKRLRMTEIAGATVYRGILGYGAKGRTHRASFLHISKDLPIMISVVDTPEKIAAAIAIVEQMLEDGLIVVSDADFVRLIRSQRSADA